MLCFTNILLVVYLVGTVWIHGREQKEWNTQSLRARMTYLRRQELPLCLPAGLIAGCRPGMSQLSVEEYNREVSLLGCTGASVLLTALPKGAATRVGKEGNAFDGVTLTAGKYEINGL